MKRLALVLILLMGGSLTANAAVVAGRAGCGSQSSVEYSVQFGWNQAGQLTDVFLTKAVGRADPEILRFNMKTDVQSFRIAGNRYVLNVRDAAGDSVNMNLSVDKDLVGTGKISWAIRSENFSETNAAAICSF